MKDETQVTSEQTAEQAQDMTMDKNAPTKAENTHDEVQESTAPEVETDVAEEKVIDETQEKIAELEAKLEESENRYLRLYADFENFRRRTQLDREAGEKYRAQSLVTNLLPAIDNFERAMQVEPDNEQAKSLLTGVEMVYRGIIDALKQEGAVQIEAVGQEFDPTLHQAVVQVEDEQFGSNIVVEEFQKGYKLNDRTIRPSMVKVNK